MDQFKVLVTDDHDLFREGIKTLLKKMEDLLLIGEARNGVEAVDLYTRYRPDLVLLDISMPEMNGIEASKEILALDPDANIIILSMYDDEEYISSCLHMGVKGYVSKSETGSELQHSIESVLQGNNYVSYSAQHVILNRIKEDAHKKQVIAFTEGSEARITQREQEVLNLILEGLTSHEMSKQMQISIRTVETHRANIMRKLHAKNAVELVRKAMQLNLVH